MGATLGREADAVEFLEALAASPHRYDFYQTMRLLECLWGDQPRWGTAPRPADEPVRLSQAPDLTFAPTAIAAFEPGHDRAKPRLTVFFGGLFGPNGPLPLHLTEYARERVRNAGDATLCRFLDLFHHRFLALLYRAWAQAQPHVSHDRPDADHVAGFVASFMGITPAGFRRRDGLPDPAKFFHVSTLVRHVRNADGLASILHQYFDVPVRIEEFVGHWLVIQPRDRTRVGRSCAALGAEAVLGGAVWDRQSKFRVRLGPLTWQQYERFLPGHGPLRQLVDWVRFYQCFELDWDVRLVLARREVPPLTLGQGARLGWTAWLGTRRSSRDADDLCLNVEALGNVVGADAA